MSNVATLTFAGDTANVEKAFDKVGSASEGMSKRVGDSASGFDRAGEAADGAEGKAQGFSDTLTGTADVASGTAMIMKGNLFEGFVTVGQGAADLAGGFADFLIPALAKTKVATLASAAASNVAAGASKAWAFATKILNLAFLTSPIGLIIIGIVALVAVVILIAKRTDWFSKLWKVAWRFIVNEAKEAWTFIKKIPGFTRDAFAKIASFITAPYRAAFNAIADAWNNTIGRLSFSVPDWVPGIGGKGFSVPNLPHFHSGGVMPGTPGSEQIAVLQAGERISAATSSRGDGDIVIRGDGSQIAEGLILILSKAIQRKGGNVQVVLGSANGG